MATFMFDVCFNLEKCEQHGVESLDHIMEPLYKKWGASCYATEYGPLDGKPEDVERIIALEDVPERHIEETILYFDDKPYARIDVMSKLLEGSPEKCSDDCGMYVRECDRCKNRYYYFEGLPKNPTKLDEWIFDRFKQDHEVFRNNLNDKSDLIRGITKEEMHTYLAEKYAITQ